MSTTDQRRLSVAERALLNVCGFDWNDAFGQWIDSDGNSWDDEREVVEECLALADSGWQPDVPEGWPDAS